MTEPATTWEPFQHGVWLYDLLPVPTHPRAIRRALGGRTGTMLDLGGGTGKYTARFFRPKRDRVLVVDPSRPMMMRARAKRRPLRLVQAVGHHLPFGDATVDAVTATESFHHFGEAQDAIVDEVARVLRPDGLFVVEEPDVTRLPGRLMARSEHAGHLGSQFLSPDALASALRRRFADVSVQRASWMTVIATARRPQPL